MKIELNNTTFSIIKNRLNIANEIVIADDLMVVDQSFIDMHCEKSGDTTIYETLGNIVIDTKRFYFIKFKD